MNGEKAVKAKGSTDGTLLRVKDKELCGHTSRFGVQVIHGFGNRGSGALPEEMA